MTCGKVSCGIEHPTAEQFRRCKQSVPFAMRITRSLRLIHIFNDITEQKDSENRIKRKVITDGLTGLANREGLLQTLEAAVAKAKADEVELALIFMDLDNFKPVNDSHGHQVGDIFY